MECYHFEWSIEVCMGLFIYLFFLKTFLPAPEAILVTIQSLG